MRLSGLVFSLVRVPVWHYGFTNPVYPPRGKYRLAGWRLLHFKKKPETLNPEPETAKLGLTSRDLPDVLREYARSIFSSPDPEPDHTLVDRYRTDSHAGHHCSNIDCLVRGLSGA